MNKRLASKSTHIQGYTLVLISSMFYGSYGVWSKLMGDSFGGFAQAAIRSLLVVVYLLFIAIVKKELSKIYWKRDIKWFIALLVSSIFIGGPLYYAFLNAGVAITTIIFYVGLLIGYFIFGKFLSGEKFTKDKIIATFVALIGLYLVFSPELSGGKLLALAAALGSGFAAGLNVVTTQKIKYSASQSAIFGWASGVIVNIPLAFLLHQHVPKLAFSKGWVALLAYSVASLFASWLTISGSKLIEAGMVGIIGMSEVVFGVVFGLVFFAEKLYISTLLGMICIITAASIPYITEYRSKIHES